MAGSSLIIKDLDRAIKTNSPKKRSVKKSVTTKKTPTKSTVKKATKKTTSEVLSETISTTTNTTRTPLQPVPARQPLGHLLVEHILREAGFAGGISSDKTILDAYSTDESIFSVRPQIVLQPKHQKDIEIAVSVLAKETKRFSSLSLTPRAAGTGLSGGSLTDSIVIDVCKYMHHINTPKVYKGVTTVTCGPGAMWRNVEKILKKYDRYLPSYPASKDICSIGGAVGNNSAGPDSLRYGHMAEWVEALDITLYDGKTYTLRPITYSEYKSLIKKQNALADILESVFTILEKHEKTIQAAKPKTSKNTAGYALWDVMSGSVSSFKRGTGTMDLTRIVTGSQGTVGVITSVTLRTEPISHDSALVVIPVFDLLDAGSVITAALEFNPLNVELFDGLTFDLALKNPEFFRDRLGKISYYKVLLSMYTLYHVRYRRHIPEFTLLVTIDADTLKKQPMKSIISRLKTARGTHARHITSPIEKEMYWQVRRASYTLSKFQDKTKRPAAFLEDMTVPPENISKFFVGIKKLLKKFGVTAAVHGHGGNGHLHFYPLLDFTKPGMSHLVEKMSDEFFALAVKYEGNICGEHNDGIIRTPHLSKIFNKTTLELFKDLERAFDPDDIFNPGKKVNPRFDVKHNLRHTN